MPEKIQEYFGDGSKHGITIKYHGGRADDLTGTRLVNAKHLLAGRFLLMYCDNVWPINLKKMLEDYHERKAPVMATVYDNRMGGGEYGPVSNMTIGENGFVTHYGDLAPVEEKWGLDIGFSIVDKR